MRLDAYLRLQGKTYRQFADEVEESASVINRFATGRRTPSLIQAARIAKATGGAVSFEDFLADAKSASDQAAEAA